MQHNVSLVKSMPIEPEPEPTPLPQCPPAHSYRLANHMVARASVRRAFARKDGMLDAAYFVKEELWDRMHDIFYVVLIG